METTYSPLTPYYARICRLLIDGYSTKEIADILGSNPGAIRISIYRATHSVGVKNRVALAAWYAMNYIVTS